MATAQEALPGVAFSGSDGRSRELGERENMTASGRNYPMSQQQVGNQIAPPDTALTAWHYHGSNAFRFSNSV